MLRNRLSQSAAWMLSIAGILASAGTAKAEFFEYTSSVLISNAAGTYTPGTATITNPAGNQTASFQSDNNTVTLLAQSSNPAPPHLNALIGTDIAAMGIDANTGIGGVNDLIAFNFSLTVTITNYTSATAAASTGSGSLSFTGRLGGNVGNNAVNIDLLSFATTPQSILINEALYTVSFKNFASPGLDNNGTLSLKVTARAVPEPSSMALIAIGLGGAFAVARRRNRASA